MYFLNLNFTNADFSMYLVDLKEEVYVTVNRMKVSEKKTVSVYRRYTVFRAGLFTYASINVHQIPFILLCIMPG